MCTAGDRSSIWIYTSRCTLSQWCPFASQCRARDGIQNASQICRPAEKQDSTSYVSGDDFFRCRIQSDVPYLGVVSHFKRQTLGNVGGRNKLCIKIVSSLAVFVFVRSSLQARRSAFARTQLAGLRSLSSSARAWQGQHLHPRTNEAAGARYRYHDTRWAPFCRKQPLCITCANAMNHALTCR